MKIAKAGCPESNFIIREAYYNDELDKNTYCQPWSRTEGTMLRKHIFGLAKRRQPRTLGDIL